MKQHFLILWMGGWDKTSQQAANWLTSCNTYYPLDPQPQGKAPGAWRSNFLSQENIFSADCAAGSSVLGVRIGFNKDSNPAFYLCADPYPRSQVKDRTLIIQKLNLINLRSNRFWMVSFFNNFYQFRCYWMRLLESQINVDPHLKPGSRRAWKMDQLHSKAIFYVSLLFYCWSRNKIL